MSPTAYKTIVIGSGPAGYSTALRIAQLGGSVAIVERDAIGGICVNWGCTPSKAMIVSAKYAKMAKEAAAYGIYTENLRIDFERIAERRDDVISHARQEITHLLQQAGVALYTGEAVVQSDTHTVRIHATDGSDTTITGEYIVFATGSSPLVPSFLQKEDVSIVNSNHLIRIKKLPEQVTIIGGGIIGLEFATMFCHFGTKVTVVEMMERCLSQLDPEISFAIESELRAKGVQILTGHKVLDISHGVLQVEQMSTQKVSSIPSPMNLIAIGRKANINTPYLQGLHIACSPHGITVDEHMRTNIPHIYAVGDVTGKSILAHVAIEQATVCAHAIMGIADRMDYRVIPAVVYTLPEVATVGTVSTDPDVQTYTYPFRANLKAVIEGKAHGFVKLWIRDNRLIATQIVGDYAGEIIQGYANIIALNTPIEDVANIIHAHPTYNEIVRNSLEYALGRALEYRGESRD